MSQEKAKKLVSVLTIFMLATEDSEEAILVSAKELERVMCIQYSITFQGSVTHNSSALDFVSALFDISSEVNAIHPTFAKKLGLVLRSTNIDAQKIDGLAFEIYRIVIAAFLMTDQADRVRFFEETFLLANVSPDVVFGMFFLTLSIADIAFPKKELQWTSYTIKKAFSTTKQVKLIGKKKFAAIALDPEYEIFIVYEAFLKNSS